MNTGQMLLTIGAMILLSTLILRVNNNFAGNTATVYDSKFAILATSVGASVIEEAMGKAFDENTASGPASQFSDLTAPNKLGPDGSESYPNFNDFDDYNGYTKVDSTMPSAVFDIQCTVCYVYPDNPNVAANTATWTKKISVIVYADKNSTSLMTDTVRLSSLFSYWVFN